MDQVHPDVRERPGLVGATRFLPRHPGVTCGRERSGPMSATILVVDDENDIVTTVEYALRKEGYRTLSALNGRDGLQLATREPVPAGAMPQDNTRTRPAT